jgi:hypothetical protein
MAEGATWCEACGADAPMAAKERRRPSRWPWVGVVIVLAAVGAWLYAPHPSPLPRTDTGPIRVVKQRPGGSAKAAGATLTQPEATIALRRHFTARPENPIKVECLAIAGRGSSGGTYAFDVFDRCENERLGRWRVNGTSGEVSKPDR